MIQEYIAFGAFLTAIVIATLSIVRFIIAQLNHKGKTQCSSSCSCKTDSARKLTPGHISVRNNHLKSVKLK